MRVGPRNILIVDPDERLRRLLDLTLRKEGYSVTGAGTAEEGLNACRLVAPDVSVVDLPVDDGGGWDFLRRLRGTPELAAIPIIGTSDSRDPTITVRAAQLGVDTVIPKPLYARDVMTRVELTLAMQSDRRRQDALAAGHGVLQETPLVDLLHAIASGGRSGAIRVAHGRLSGAIYFENGEVIDASSGRDEGETALHRLFCWQTGEWEIKFVPTTGRTRRIRRTLADAIADATLFAADWQEAALQMGSLDAVYTVEYRSFATQLGALPEEVNSLVRMFDGMRSLEEACALCELNDLIALRVAKKLRDAKMLVEVQKPRLVDDAEEFKRLGTAEYQPIVHSAPGSQLDAWLSGTTARRREEEERRREEEERRRAESEAKRAEEERRKRDDEERARLESELRRQDEERRRREEEERARAEADARRAAEERRQREAEERRRLEDEERRRREEEDRRRREEEERQRREEEDRRRREEEERRLREEEERRRRLELERLAAEEAELEAERRRASAEADAVAEQLRREAEERAAAARREADERLRLRQEAIEREKMRITGQIPSVAEIHATPAVPSASAPAGTAPSPSVSATPTVLATPALSPATTRDVPALGPTGSTAPYPTAAASAPDAAELPPASRTPSTLPSTPVAPLMAAVAERQAAAAGAMPAQQVLRPGGSSPGIPHESRTPSDSGRRRDGLEDSFFSRPHEEPRQDEAIFHEPERRGPPGWVWVVGGIAFFAILLLVLRPSRSDEDPSPRDRAPADAGVSASVDAVVIDVDAGPSPEELERQRRQELTIQAEQHGIDRAMETEDRAFEVLASISGSAPGIAPPPAPLPPTPAPPGTQPPARAEPEPDDDGPPPADEPPPTGDRALRSCSRAYETGNYSDALAACEEAVRANPGSSEAFTYLGRAHYEIGNTSDAIRNLERAVSINRRNTNAYLTLGAARQEAGDNAGAREAYERYLELSPDGRRAPEIRAILQNL